MSVKLEWIPAIEASDRRKAGWIEIELHGGIEAAPGCFLMASPVEEEGAMSKAPGSGESDRARGLYNKFSVTRSDGSSAFGKKHHGCEYFVLDLTHDKFAWPALHAYAGACADEFPALSGDLSKMCVQHEPAAPIEEEAAKVECTNCGEDKYRGAHVHPDCYNYGVPLTYVCGKKTPIREPAVPESPTEHDKNSDVQGEMPEAVKMAIYQLRQNVRLWQLYGEQPASEVDRKAADALESWWRSRTQPVGISEELESVLRSAKEYEMAVRTGTRVEWHTYDADRIGAAIATVRAQYGGKP